MDIGLRAKIEPELDERQTKREASKLREYMMESVEELVVDTQMKDSIEQAQEMKEHTEDASDHIEEAEESISRLAEVMSEQRLSTMSAGAQARGDRGGAFAMAGGGQQPPGGFKDQAMDAARGRAIEKGKELAQQTTVGQKAMGVMGRGTSGGSSAGGTSGIMARLGAIAASLGTISTALLAGGATVAIGGLALLGIMQVAKALQKHSPLLEQVVDMWNLAMSLLIRPFAAKLGKWLLPMVAGILRLAANFNRVFGDKGLLEALGWLAVNIVHGFGEFLWNVAKWIVRTSISLTADILMWMLMALLPFIILGMKFFEWVLGEDALFSGDVSLPDFKWSRFIDMMNWDRFIPHGLNWGKFIDIMNWNRFIPGMSWGGFIKPLGWGGWLTTLSWSGFVPNLRWSGWVGTLSWDSWIEGLEWGSWIEGVEWGAFVKTLSWGNWISGPSWGAYIEPVDWGGWLSTLSWRSWVDDLHWGGWVDNLHWKNFIPKVDWGKYIPDAPKLGSINPVDGGGGGGGLIPGGKWFKFATGGVVTGPTQAIIGEGSESEAVLPLSKLQTLIDQPEVETQSSVSVEAEIDLGQDINPLSRSDLEDAVASALGADLEDISSSLSELADEVRRAGLGGPIKITADGKVIAEVSEDGKDTYMRSKEINR